MSITILEIVDLLSKALFFLGYFSNFKKLSAPLQPEEEALYLERMVHGDEQARDQLIEHNLRLVIHIAKKYHNTPIDMEDLISIGIIGLIKALDSYDLRKQTKFSTFAARCIDNEILMALRMNMRSATNIYLDDVVSCSEDGSKLSLYEMVAEQREGQDDFDQSENHLTLKSILALIDTHLTKIEATVIKMRYALDRSEALTQSKIAKILGISRSYVSRIEKRAIEKLAKYALN